MAEPHDHLNAAAKQGQQAADSLQAALERAYGRALRAAGRRAAAAFRRSQPVLAAADPPGWTPPPAGSVINGQELADDTQRKTSRLHGRMLTASAVPALDPFGIRFDITAPVPQAILAQYAARIQATIETAISEQVTEAIQEGYAAGASVAQVAAAIQTKVDAISRPRAEMLARSDLNGIANAGSLYAATVTGAAATKTWTTAGDDRVRPDHEDAEGQTVPIGDPFDIGGESAMYPGDPQLSWEESANCRCTLTYGNPLTASAPREARPSDFERWRDYAWEGEAEKGRQNIPVLFSAAPAGMLYLARHGLTAYDSDNHATDTIRGWADDPLTDEGCAEARQLAAGLAGRGIDLILSSDLQRAATTAEIIADGLGIGSVPTEVLRPWNLGDFQGRTSDDARDDIAAYCDEPDEPVPGGESFNDFCSRFLPEVASAMALAEQGRRPLLVTHSHNLKLALAWIGKGRHPVTGDEFMEPAPAPASALAFDPARSWAASEILADGEPPDEAGHVPTRVHYRPADDPDRACGSCAFFDAAASRCSMFEGDPPVLADYVCDEYVARSALTSGGNMSEIGYITHPDSPNDFALFRESFAASGGTSLPLSERDRTWDAPSATKRVAKWASSDGSGDKEKVDWGKYGRAFFAGSGEDFGDYHLPFCDIIGGKLTAVWKGIVAAGGRLNQTQGVDRAAIAKKIDGWYRKAAKQYNDPSIVAPSQKKGAAADGETLALIRARLADEGADVLEDDELRAIILAVRAAEGLGAPAVAAETDGLPLLAAGPEGTQWQATLCVADEPTVDSGVKRLLVSGGGSWRPLPLPLALLDDSPHAEVTTKAPICGRIDQIWWAGNVCQASGVFFDASDDPKVAEAGSKAAALVSGMRRLGISVDLVDVDAELYAWNGSSISSMDDANDPTAHNDENAPGGPATEANLPSDIPEADVEPDEDDEGQEYVMAFRQWVIAGATICPVQALTRAQIVIVASGLMERPAFVASGFVGGGVFRWYNPEPNFEQPSLTASAAGLAPTYPPAAWFATPEADEPTPLTVTDEGHVFGHIALWNSCHTGFASQCVPPPKSPSNYAGFHLGELRLESGDRLAVGTLTMDAGHAGRRLSAQAAVDHYDHTGTAAAYVRASDGRHGIWVAGTLSPRLAAEDAQALMAAKPSGDWRQIFRGKGRDLIGALAVNVPGFPVPRTLTAAGMPQGEVSVEFRSECEPCEEALGRELAVLAASADGIEGLAALVS